MAAARKVSPAASMTLRPSARNLAASLPMVVVLPGAVDADDEDHERLCAGDHERLRHRRQDFLQICGEQGFHLFDAVIAPLAHLRRHAGRDVDAEIGADQRLLDLDDPLGGERAAHEQVGNGGAERARRALQPAGEALPPALCAPVVWLCAVIHIAGRDSGFTDERKDDPGRDGGSAALSRWPDAGHRQAGGVRRPPRTEGRREPGGSLRRAALRAAALAGARASARPRHLRLPGARPPPQGAGRARPAVQGRPRRQDLLGGGGRRPRRRTKAASSSRSAARTPPAAGG